MCVSVSELCHSNDRSMKTKVIAKLCGTVFVGCSAVVGVVVVVRLSEFHCQSLLTSSL